MQSELAEAATPETVTIGAGGRVLSLQRAASQLRFEADQLRRACRCAACAGARLRGTEIVPAAGIRLTAAVPIGGYALNLAFSDGHARGVFPFAYLAELATETAA
jgi:DUF971 family protein